MNINIPSVTVFRPCELLHVVHFSIFSFKIDVVALRMLHHCCNSFRLTHCCPLWSSTKSQLILESCSITYDWSKKLMCVDLIYPYLATCRHQQIAQSDVRLMANWQIDTKRHRWVQLGRGPRPSDTRIAPSGSTGLVSCFTTKKTFVIWFKLAQWMQHMARGLIIFWHSLIRQMYETDYI